MAWIRTLVGTEELVVVSDSRLRWGRSWDCCPKILMLPRTDSVISFAGSTAYTYPLMLQAINAIRMYPPAMNRGMSVEQLRGYLLQIFENMRRDIHDFPKPKDNEQPDALILLSGIRGGSHVSECGPSITIEALSDSTSAHIVMDT